MYFLSTYENIHYCKPYQVYLLPFYHLVLQVSEELTVDHDYLINFWVKRDVRIPFWRKSHCKLWEAEVTSLGCSIFSKVMFGYLYYSLWQKKAVSNHPLRICIQIHIRSTWNTSKAVFDLILDSLHLYIPVTSADTILIHTSPLSPKLSCPLFTSASISVKSVVLSRTKLGSKFLSREKDFFCQFRRRHHSQRLFSSKQNILCFFFSLSPFFPSSNFHCTILGEGNFCNMEKMTLAWHNHHCSKREQGKKKPDKPHNSKCGKKLMPPQKDNRDQWWD